MGNKTAMFETGCKVINILWQKSPRHTRLITAFNRKNIMLIYLQEDGTSWL